MAKHLTNRDIDAIVNIINGHDGEKLSWEEICDAAEPIVGKKPTRQSLSAHEAVKGAYKSKKKSLKLKSPSKPKPSSLTVAADRIAKLLSENEQLRQKNNALLEQFVVWQYNAYKYGMKEHQLNASLPRIDRERSD